MPWGRSKGGGVEGARQGGQDGRGQCRALRIRVQTVDFILCALGSHGGLTWGVALFNLYF